MSKKMKSVSMNPAPYGSYEDAKARFKHQTLIQDYKELHKEAEAMRNKLESTKKRKLTLLAEVRFLRRRYKYLLESKAAKPPQGREMVQAQSVTPHKNIVKPKTIHRKKANLPKTATIYDVNKKERISSRKDSGFQNPSPVIELNQTNRIRSGKEAILRNTSTVFDINQKGRLYGGNEAAFRKPTPILDLKQKERLFSGKEIAPIPIPIPAPAFDLNQIGRNYVRGNAVQSRAPIFDLNQISGEEEDLQANYEPLRIEEPKKFVSRGGTDEQHNDLKLCRNVGNGPNRAGKRKISWQDPVALKV